MSKEERNTEILKQAYEIWHETKGGSVDHLLSIVADEIDFRSLADGAPGLDFTCAACSKGDLQRYFAGLSEGMEMIHYTVERYIAQGDYVVAVGATSWQVKETGKIFDTPKVDVVRFEDGKIIEFTEYYDTAMVLAATQA